MTPFDKARTVTALAIFSLVAVVALYVGYRGSLLTRTDTFKRNGNGVLWLIGLWILLLWIMRDVWYYGIFGAALDLRVWLLGIAIYLLYRRLGRIKEGQQSGSVSGADLSSKGH
jgi:hypothetical protein